jgi:hypothetical protein
MAKMEKLDLVVLVLILIGALNWGLVGIGGFIGSNLNVVNLLLGSIPTIENVVYLLVGLAALYKIYQLVAKK